jgi:hypothetical protein
MLHTHMVKLEVIYFFQDISIYTYINILYINPLALLGL